MKYPLRDLYALDEKMQDLRGEITLQKLKLEKLKTALFNLNTPRSENEEGFDKKQNEELKKKVREQIEKIKKLILEFEMEYEKIDNSKIKSQADAIKNAISRF